MTTAEKLIKVAENEAIVKDAVEQLDLCLKGGKVDGKSWYDEFWDAFQDNGNRTGYAQTFYNIGWNENTYNPKYDIVCVGNNYGLFGSSRITDTKKTINISSATNTDQLFGYCKLLKTIRKLVVSENTPYGANTFRDCVELVNLTTEGTIGKNGFDLHWSTKLSADSLKSIINALSTTTTGLTITLPTTAQANYEAVYGSGSWNVLTATRSNWTIAYA